MLCCSLLHDGDQLLDGGKGLEAYVEQGATMGIPLLYPWANRIDGFDYRAAGKVSSLVDGQLWRGRQFGSVIVWHRAVPLGVALAVLGLGAGGWGSTGA